MTASLENGDARKIWGMHNFGDAQFWGRSILGMRQNRRFHSTDTSENIVGKGENAGNHFLFFPCFLLIQKQISNFQSHLFSCLQMLPIWTSLKCCCLVMG